MKKTYINPEVKVSKINTSCYMQATSNMRIMGDNYDGGSITIGAKERDDDHESDGWKDGLW